MSKDTVVSLPIDLFRPLPLGIILPLVVNLIPALDSFARQCTVLLLLGDASVEETIFVRRKDVVHESFHRDDGLSPETGANSATDLVWEWSNFSIEVR